MGKWGINPGGKGLKRGNVPKRGLCPKCGKRGMKEPQPSARDGKACLVRSCQYCAHTEVETW